MRRIIAFLSLTALALGGLSAVLPHPASAGPLYYPGNEDKWALIVGIDQHYGRTRTNVGSAGDAEDLYNALVNTYHWQASHIRLLTNKSATQQAIRDGFRWLIDNSNERTLSIFHYSGHVKQVNDKKDRDKDGEKMDEFLWPADNKFIMDNELAANMKAIRGLAWVDISGCEAAGLDDGIASDRRLFTGSSQENEKSYESKEWRNSIFSGLLIDYGLTQKSADANGNGSVTIHEALNFAAQYAPKMTSNKKSAPNGPQHPYVAGGDGTEWLLDPPPPPPPPPPPKPAKKCLVNPVLCL